MLASAQSRCRWWALRGIRPALAEEARGRVELSRFARGALVIASKARSGPVPLRWAYLGRSAGSGLRSLRRLGGGWNFRALREGVLLFASKARCGPIPLRWAYLGAPRDQACARTLAGRLGERAAFGAPQRGTAYQPGVKPRVWRTNGAF